MPEGLWPAELGEVMQHLGRDNGFAVKSFPQNEGNSLILVIFFGTDISGPE